MRADLPRGIAKPAMFIRWQTYTSSTGPVEQRFDYACAHCGAHAAAVVRTIGVGTSTAFYGSGGGDAGAREGATHAAWNNAVHAMSTVSCPHCGRLPPLLLSQIEATRARLDKQRRVRLPAVAIAVGLTALVTMIPALLDLRNSVTGLLSAVAAVLFVASLVSLVISWPPHVPNLARRGDVWLFWGQHPYEPTWVQAPPPVAPGPPIRVMRAGQVLSLITMGISFIVGIVSLALLSSTYVKVWVVDATNSGDLTVEIDGKVQGHVRTSTADANDVSFGTFSVRRGHEHTIVLSQPNGTRHTLTLDDAADGKRGWVVAPEAAAHDLCIVQSEIVYTASTTGKPPDAKLLNEEGRSVVAVRVSIDYAFEAPPKTMSTKEREVRKQSLRAYVCSELDADDLVPYRDRRPATAKPEPEPEPADD